MSNEDTLYARYLSGELTEAEVKQLKQNGDWDQLAAIVNITDDFEMPAIDKKKHFEAFKHQNDFGQKSETSKTFYLRIAQGIAASLVLIAAYFFLFNNQLSELQSPLAQNTTHTFIDETDVRLNAGSKLTYNHRDWSSQRHVALTGEAFFNVTKGNTFTVETTLGTIEVLGTSFNVRARDDRLNVQCYSGSVRVRQGTKDVVLSAKQAVVFDKTGNLDEYNLTVNTPEWTAGRSKFQNEPIQHVLKELGRQYDVKVSYSSLTMPFTGSFDHDNLNSAIEQIARPMRLKYELSKNGKQLSFSK